MDCSSVGCEKPARWRGLCRRHYIEDQYRDTPHPSADELARRVFAKVDASGPCWLWLGAVAKDRNGYGLFGWNAVGRNHTRWVHRWVYEYLVGPIPDGMHLDHLCRVTRGCNPDHLEVVTPAENARRARDSWSGHLRRHGRTDGVGTRRRVA